MELKLFNTLKRKKQTFKPLKGKTINLYTCGPTVYNYAHIGNLRSYIFEDILKRVLLMNKFKVKHVMNITDVGHLTDDADDGEDKLERAALKEKKDVWELSRFYFKAFQQNLVDLNILEPTKFTRATDYIKEQIKLVGVLEEKGFTYKTSDGIYFDTSKLADYGKLAGADYIKGIQEGARVDIKEKRGATDFALWKFSDVIGAGGAKAGAKKRQMEWDSPWGKGFPGWHIECSAMAMKELGQTIDIHCGGVDHIPIHHTNEIAQSESATGKEFARFWMHNEFVVISGGAGAGAKDDSKTEAETKMAKSAGNFITLNDVIERGYDALTYRYFLLQTHYRKQISFSWDALDGAKAGLEKLVARLSLVKPASKRDETLYKQVIKSFNDDLNTSKALGFIWKALGKSGDVNPEVVATVLILDDVLGLNLLNKIKNPSSGAGIGSGSGSGGAISAGEIPKYVQKILDERAKARANKDWESSDKLRDLLKKKGWDVKDGENGQVLGRV